MDEFDANIQEADNQLFLNMYGTKEDLITNPDEGKEIIEHCRYLLASHKRGVFVDHWKECFFVYRPSVQAGRSILKKMFEIQCNSETLCDNVKYVVVDTTRYLVNPSDATTLLNEVKLVCENQKRKNAKKLQQAQEKQTKAIQSNQETQR